MKQTLQAVLLFLCLVLISTQLVLKASRISDPGCYKDNWTGASGMDPAYRTCSGPQGNGTCYTFRCDHTCAQGGGMCTGWDFYGDWCDDVVPWATAGSPPCCCLGQYW